MPMRAPAGRTPEDRPANAAPAALALSATAASRAGPRHRQNEDAHAVVAEAGLFAVCDGIGGLCDGAVASRVVAELLQRAVPPGAALDIRLAEAREALARANAALFQAGEETRRPMGATVVLAIVGEACAVCLWAGDSRAYLMRAGALLQLTQDHAVLGRPHADAPPRMVVTRAIGPDAAVDIDCAIVDLRPGDCLLLCSDGVSGTVPAARIEALLAATPAAGAQELVAEAAARGTRDDATAVVVRVHPAEASHVAPR
ncbi:PP2C family serine/threonine-protein phosphatase [Xanthobacter sp. V2C-8]|uniref:PP2C family protein-serine/threonine phosphatase n=1 Tax=Xanthobacter albus TaxID=3119929 RepID=UPI003726F812